MSFSLAFHIPYLIWAIIFVFIFVFILIFCFVRARHYLANSRRRGNAAELVLDDTPVVPAMVLVNSVSDTGTREQHAAAMAELRRQYVEERATTMPAEGAAAPEQHAWYVMEPTPQAAGGAAEREALPPVVVTVGAHVFQEEQEETEGAEDDSESVELFTQQISSARPQLSVFRDTTEGEGGSFLNPYALAQPPTQQHRQHEDDAPQTEGLHSSAAYQGNSGTGGPAAAHFSITLLVAANPRPLGIAHSNTLSPMYLRRNREDGQLMLVPVAAPSSRRRELQRQQEQEQHSPAHPSEAPRPYPGVMTAAATAVGRPSFLRDAHALMRGRGRRRGSTADATTSPPSAGQRRVSRGGGRNNEQALVAEGYCCDEHGHKLTVRQAEDVYGTAAYIPQRGHNLNVLVDAAEEKTDSRDEEREEVESSVFSFNPLARYRVEGC